MALKFADTAKPMGLFPVAEAVDIELTKKDDSKKSLQAMYDDGELGGGEGLPLPEQANMVMMTYEKEDGDLDWKQSLIKSVEKVTEMPTTFENKVYVVDVEEEGTATELGYPLRDQNLDEMANFIKQKLIEIGATEDIVTVSLFEKGSFYIYLDIEYDDTKYDLIRRIYNDSSGKTSIQHNIHMFGYENTSRTSYWCYSEKPHQTSSSTEYRVDLIFVDKNKKMPSQVFASEVELATKEYADTHGAGASVYTKAEWEALPAKPPAGTQVIISDDIPELIDAVLTAEFEDGTIKRYKLTGKEV